MLTLTEDELQEITQKRRRSSQKDVLRALRIPFRIRPDGTLVVMRASVDPHRPDKSTAWEPQVRMP